jgi:hypothetical protein
MHNKIQVSNRLGVTGLATSETLLQGTLTNRRGGFNHQSPFGRAYPSLSPRQAFLLVWFDFVSGIDTTKSIDERRTRGLKEGLKSKGNPRKG